LRKGLVLFLCSTSFFMSYFSRLVWSIVSSFSPLRPTQVDDGVIFSLFFVGYVVVQIPSGFLADVVGARKVLTGSLLGLAVSALGSALSPSIPWEYVSSTVMGLSAGWIYPTTIKVLATTFDTGSIHKAIGLYSLAWPLSIVASGFVVPPLATISWDAPYFLLGGTSVALSFLAWHVVEDGKGDGRRGISVIKDRSVLSISLGGFMFFFSYWSLTLFLYKFLLEVGYSPVEAGVIYSLTAIAGIPSTLISGRFLDMLGTRRSLLLFIGIYGLLILLINVSYAYLVPLSLLFLSMGFVRFVITPSHSSALASLGGRSGGVSGFANFFWQASGAVSSLISPIVVESLGYEFLWDLTGFITLASLGFYYMIRVKN